MATSKAKLLKLDKLIFGVLHASTQIVQEIVAVRCAFSHLFEPLGRGSILPIRGHRAIQGPVGLVSSGLIHQGLHLFDLALADFGLILQAHHLRVLFGLVDLVHDKLLFFLELAAWCDLLRELVLDLGLGGVS